MYSSPISNQARSQPLTSGKPRRYIVALNDRVKDDQSLRFLEQDGFRHLETFDFPEKSFPGMGGDIILVEAINPSDHQQALEELTEDPRVEFAEEDLEVRLRESQERRTPDDLKSSLWGLDDHRDKDIDAPEAWATTTGSRSKGPVIAVLDTGVDLDHPDLQANLWTNPREIPDNGKDDDNNGVIDDYHGYDAYNKNGNPDDRDGHGTHCAGTIGAAGDNGQGVVGVNWQAQLMPIKIFNDKEDPRAPRSAILRGISYAGRMGARLTSNSWGGGGKSRSVRKAFQRSKALHLMAAGNDAENNDEVPHYPSNYRVANSLAVASTTRWGELSYFSNYGQKTVDIAAPGSSIYSTIPGGKYGYKSGTSMACPHVTGIAGLLLTRDPSLSNEEIKKAIMDGAKPEEQLKGKVIAEGIASAKGALEQVNSASKP